MLAAERLPGKARGGALRLLAACIAIWVLGCLLSLSFWIIGIGALVATRAGMPPRLVPMASGADGSPCTPG